MPEKHLFEYAVIRVVPRVAREEFLNVGVILFCKSQRFLQAKITVDEKRLCSFCDKVDMPELKAHLKAFEAICHGEKGTGPIAELDKPSRFRWLTAKRSTMIQTSQVHPGLSGDLNETLSHLFEQLVL